MRLGRSALIQKGLDTPQRFKQMIYRVGIGDADKPFSGFPKRIAGNHRNLLII